MAWWSVQVTDDDPRGMGSVGRCISEAFCDFGSQHGVRWRRPWPFGSVWSVFHGFRLSELVQETPPTPELGMEISEASREVWVWVLSFQMRSAPEMGRVVHVGNSINEGSCMGRAIDQ